VVGVENHQNVLRTLKYAKEKYQLRPELVTVDFSPNLIEPVCQVFGAETLQIDGFHVMQLLNRGIKDDLLNFRCHKFKKDIKILRQFRQRITLVQKCEEKSSKVLKQVLKENRGVESSNLHIFACKIITDELFQLLLLQEPSEFELQLHQWLIHPHFPNQEALRKLKTSLTNTLPDRHLTIKGRNHLQVVILRALKSYYKNFRHELEYESKNFFKNYWILFYQPEKLTIERQQRLEMFLTQYPELLEYRLLTLAVGSLYRTPIDEIDTTLIDHLTIREYFTDKLQTALQTIKKFKTAILRFIGFFQKHPEFPRACRANMESFNRNFKAPFKAGLNCTKLPHLQVKLQLQLNCEVRFFVDCQEGAIINEIQN